MLLTFKSKYMFIRTLDKSQKSTSYFCLNDTLVNYYFLTYSCNMMSLL